ncbi:hypothetical protein OG535_10095 [Kitasatospora sp. NBC_00085]|uniref:hypothetical protein n=1 Tax=unclassified Kitasatospora TaxID=2633591 RepID=UPI0032468FE9
MNQFLRGRELWWDAEGSCAGCGSAWCEHAGPEPAPESVRVALLAAHGAARLRPTGPISGSVAALKVFREGAAVSLTHARTLVSELQRTGLTGTLAEMEYWRVRLHEAGVPVAVEDATG